MSRRPKVPSAPPRRAHREKSRVRDEVVRRQWPRVDRGGPSQPRRRTLHEAGLSIDLNADRRSSACNEYLGMIVSFPELHPVWWTPIERRIRYRPWTNRQKRPRRSFTDDFKTGAPSINRSPPPGCGVHRRRLAQRRPGSAHIRVDQAVIEGKWDRIADHKLCEIRVGGIDEDVGFTARMHGRYLERQRRTALQPGVADHPCGATVGNVIH